MGSPACDAWPAVVVTFQPAPVSPSQPGLAIPATIVAPEALRGSSSKNTNSLHSNTIVAAEAVTLAVRGVSTPGARSRLMPDAKAHGGSSFACSLEGGAGGGSGSFCRSWTSNSQRLAAVLEASGASGPLRKLGAGTGALPAKDLRRVFGFPWGPEGPCGSSAKGAQAVFQHEGPQQRQGSERVEATHCQGLAPAPPPGAASEAQLRDMVLSGVASSVTALSACGSRVLYQNAASVAYYGPRAGSAARGSGSGALAAGAAAGAPDAPALCMPSEGLLAELFSMEPAKLDRMLTEVCIEGLVWRGIVQVPVSLAASQDTRAPTEALPSIDNAAAPTGRCDQPSGSLRPGHVSASVAFPSPPTPPTLRRASVGSVPAAGLAVAAPAMGALQGRLQSRISSASCATDGATEAEQLSSEVSHVPMSPGVSGVPPLSSMEPLATSTWGLMMEPPAAGGALSPRFPPAAVGPFARTSAALEPPPRGASMTGARSGRAATGSGISYGGGGRGVEAPPVLRLGGVSQGARDSSRGGDGTAGACAEILTISPSAPRVPPDPHRRQQRRLSTLRRCSDVHNYMVVAGAVLHAPEEEEEAVPGAASQAKAPITSDSGSQALMLRAPVVGGRDGSGTGRGLRRSVTRADIAQGSVTFGSVARVVAFANSLRSAPTHVSVLARFVSGAGDSAGGDADGMSIGASGVSFSIPRFASCTVPMHPAISQARLSQPHMLHSPFGTEQRLAAAREASQPISVTAAVGSRDVAPPLVARSAAASLSASVDMSSMRVGSWTAGRPQFRAMSRQQLMRSPTRDGGEDPAAPAAAGIFAPNDGHCTAPGAVSEGQMPRGDGVQCGGRDAAAAAFSALGAEQDGAATAAGGCSDSGAGGEPAPAEALLNIGGGGSGDLRGYCWHEVSAARTLDPATGQYAIVVTQTDVTAKVEAERHIALVTEAQHRLLEEIFPRHVLAYMTEEGGPWNAPPGKGLGPAGCQRPMVRDINKLATSHDEVTLLFADIQGFTPMCKVLEPRVVMAFLNDLFTRFDTRLDEFGVYKVETIGDCYFVAGGLIQEDEAGMPVVRARDSHADPLHADRVFNFAKAMLAAAAQVTLPTTGGPVRMRIGIHTGPVVSGVVGQRMPRFCLFGDTVNTTSRMESTGVAGCIHASEAAYALLQDDDWVPSGGIEVKGKGLMNTYLWAPPDVDSQELRARHIASCGAAAARLENGGGSGPSSAQAATNGSSGQVRGALDSGAALAAGLSREQRAKLAPVAAALKQHVLAAECGGCGGAGGGAGAGDAQACVGSSGCPRCACGGGGGGGRRAARHCREVVGLTESLEELANFLLAEVD